MRGETILELRPERFSAKFSTSQLAFFQLISSTGPAVAIP